MNQTNNKTATLPSTTTNSSPTSNNNNQEEEEENVSCNNNEENNDRSSRIQKKGPPPAIPTMKKKKEKTPEEKEQERLELRWEVIAEIIKTEETYVEGLKHLERFYIKPLKALVCQTVKPIITQKDVNYIFDKMDVIKSVNEGFLKQLLALNIDFNTQNDKNKSLGLIFKRTTPLFKVYTDYVNNYNNISNRVKQMMKENPQFDSYMNEMERSARKQGKVGFFSYMIAPVQRLPRYTLLLDQLLKYTPEDHPDHLALKEALELTKKVSSHVNDAVAILSNQMKMNEIDTTILKLRENLGGSSIIKPARLYVMETLNECLISDINNKLRKKITSNKKKRIYLFNDMLLIVRKGKYDGHVYFKNIYNTENSTNNNNKNNINNNNKNTTINNNNNNNLNYKIPWIYYDRDVNKNTIEIVTEEITYLVQFNTAIECNEWIDKLNQNTCCNQSNVKELRASRYIHSKIRKIINEEIKIYLDFENEEYIMGYDSKENTTFKFLKKDNFIRDITIEEEHSSIGTESIDELSFDDLSQTTTTSSSYKDNTDNFLNDKEFVMPSNSILLQFGLANSNNSNHNMLNKRRNSLSDFSKLKDEEDDEEEELYGEEVDELSSDLDSPKNHYKNHHQNGNNHRQSVDDKKTTTTNANTNTTTTTTTITKKKEAKTTSGFLSNLLSPKFNYSKSHNDVSQTTNTTVASNNNNNLTSNNNNGDDAPLLRNNNNITSPREHDTVTSNNENVNNIGTSNTHKPPMYGMMPMLPIIPHEILEKQLRKETNPYTFTNNNNNIVGNNEPSKKLPITPTNRTIRSATHTPSTTTSPYSIISTSTTTSPYNVISNSFNNNNNNTFINNNANNNANNNTSITNNAPLTPTTTSNSNTTNNINPFVTATTTTKNSVNMAVIANRAITKDSITTTTNNNNNQTLQPRPIIPLKPKSLQASPYEDNTNTASPMSLNNNNGNPYSSSPNPYNNSPNPYSPVNVSNVNTNNNHNSTTMKPIERQLSNNSLRVKSLPSNETKPIVSPEMELIRSIEERKKLLKAPPPQEKKVDDKPVWMTELKNSKLASKLKEMQDKNK